MYAVVRKIPVHLDNLLLSMKLSTVFLMEALNASNGVVSVSSMCPIRSLGIEVFVLASFNCSFSQLNSGSNVNFGPVNDLDLLLSSDMSITRVPSPAGFRSPGHCFHWLDWVLSKISKIFSVSTEAPISSHCSFRMTFARWPSKSAACSSNLATVCCFGEATRAFPSSNALLNCRVALLLYTK